MKVPKQLNDLFLDLRDKRLLPIVVLLLVMLVAIPLLLGGGATEPGSATVVGSASAADIESAVQLAPFVTSEVTGIREFDKRLNDFTRRNPFKQQLTSVPKSAQKELDQLEDPAKQSGGSSTTSPDTTTSGSAATSTTTTDTTGNSGNNGNHGNNGNGSIKQTVILFGWEIDVKVGPLGEAKKEKDVEPLEFIPGNRRPIVQFIRGDFDATEAAFAVSRSVVSTEGDGKCRPNKRDCQFLLLKTGEEQHFVYEPDGKTYRLKLLDVRLTQKKVDPSKFGR